MAKIMEMMTTMYQRKGIAKTSNVREMAAPRENISEKPHYPSSFMPFFAHQSMNPQLVPLIGIYTYVPLLIVQAPVFFGSSSRANLLNLMVVSDLDNP